MVKKEEFETSAKNLDIRGLFISAIVTALAFVVGLFWNDAIRSTIEIIIPTEGEKLYYKYVAAIIVTLIVSVVAYLLYRSQKIKKKDVVNIMERERMLAQQRVLKSVGKMKLSKEQQERIKRDILEGSEDY